MLQSKPLVLLHPWRLRVLVLVCIMVSLSNWGDPLWCPWQCMNTIFLGTHTVSKSSRISLPCFMAFPPELISPFSLHKAPCTWRVVKTYLESVYMLTCIPAASWRAQVGVRSSAFYTEVPFGRTFAWMVECRVTTEYPAGRFPSFTKLLSSMKYSVSGSSRGWSVESGLLERILYPWLQHNHDLSGLAQQVNSFAGFRVLTTLRWMRGFSHNMPWYLTIQAIVSIVSYTPLMLLMSMALRLLLLVPQSIYQLPTIRELWLQASAGRVATLGQWNQVAWKGIPLDNAMTPASELRPLAWPQCTHAHTRWGAWRCLGVPGQVCWWGLT